MGEYVYTDPATGKRVKISGPAPPPPEILRVLVGRIVTAPAHAPALPSAVPSHAQRPPSAVPSHRYTGPMIGPPIGGEEMLPSFAEIQGSSNPALGVGRHALHAMEALNRMPQGEIGGQHYEAVGGMPLTPGDLGGMAAFRAGRGLFSRVDDVVSRLPTKGALHPNKIAAQLRSGASSEELAYRGLPEFLASKGNTPVTRAELEAHLAAHPAPFPQTVTLGGGSVEAADKARQRVIKAETALRDYLTGQQAFSPMGAGDYLLDVARGDLSPAQLQAAQGNPQQWALMNELREAYSVRKEIGRPRAPTKYAQYTLPGGEAYRESLYTLPKRVNEERVTQIGNELEALYRNPTAVSNQQAAALQLERDALRYGGTFTSSHFDQPNIVAHARTTERTLPTGERGRFLEEVQSDWHQAGKKKGYGVPNEYIAYYRTSEGHEVPLGFGATEAEARAQIHPGWEDLVNVEIRSQPAPSRAGVPDAPFKESWPDLALKQQLLEAAQDPQTQWLGFTSGQTQAARYDLSKQISSLEYNATARVLSAYDPQTTRVINETVTPEKLADYIGKEAAQKLLAATPHTTARGSVIHRLEGVDLQVGGEGMRTFYDELLPKRLEKIVKPFGGTVERAPVGTGVNPPGWGTLAPEGVQNTEPAWIVRLTPELKAKLLKGGLPLMTIPLATLAAPGAPPETAK